MILITHGYGDTPLVEIAQAHWTNINPPYASKPGTYKKSQSLAGKIRAHGMHLFKAKKDPDWRFFHALCLHDFGLLKRMVMAPAADLKVLIDEVEALLIKLKLGAKADRDRVMNDVTTLFAYATWRSNGLGYALFEQLGNQVCVYCNAVLLVKDKVNKKFGGTYDHYYDKADYPYLNLSVGNLMPSCVACNQTYKKAKFCTGTHFHPHMDDYNVSCEFVSDYAPDLEAHQILISTKIDPDDRRAAVDRDLQIPIRYNQENVLQEAVTIYNLSKEFSKQRIQNLSEEYGKTVAEVAQITCGKFGIPYLPKETMNREYGKLRRDLAIQYHLIKV